tara:strand:- start:367 stop:2061 length:1695 start_codon:yes stop_codon:yes gene_type:complete
MAEYSLALGVKPLQLEDPLTSYGKFATIQNAQNQNALSQYQLGAAQRAEAKDIARTNALARAGSNTDSIAKALLDAGDLEGYGKVIKFAADQKKAERETQKSESDLLDASLNRATTAIIQSPTIQDLSSVIDSVYDPTTPTGKFFASVGHDVSKVKALIDDAATDPTGQKFFNLKSTFALKGKELVDHLRAQAEAAQLGSKPQAGAMSAPAPTGNALVAPVAGVSNAMVAQPAPAPAPAATTFAAGRLARVEQEINQMQDVLASYPENKRAAERLKAAVEERDKLITQDRAAKQLEKPEIKQNSEGNYVAINPSTLETRVITDSKGNPVRSLDAAQKEETKRHNLEIEGQGRTKINQEDRRISQENKRIKLAEEAAARAADPEFQRKMEAAKQMGVAMGKDAALRVTQLPKVLDTAEMALNEVDALIGKRDSKGNLLKGEKPHAGFETAVGASLLPGARFVPGTAASDFQARFDQVKGGAFLQAFETLKGGGSITNVEGDKGTAALNRMSLAQSEAEFITAAREFQDIVRKGVERAKKMAGSSAAPAASEIPDLPPPGAVRRKP